MQSIAANCMQEVVSDLSHDIKKMLELCPRELYDGLPIPVNMGILVRVEFLGTDNSWPWAPLKKLFGVAQLEDARSCASSIKYMTSWNLSVDSGTKKYVIF